MNRRRRLPAAFLFRFAKKGMMPAKKEQTPLQYKQKRNIDGQKAKQENIH